LIDAVRAARRVAGLARVVSVCVAILVIATSAAAERTLVIQRFDATVDVSADGSIRVEETIVPRFTGTWNGIFRTIPVEYRTPQGLNYTLRLDIESITDDEGRSLKYESSRERHYRKLKIWVPGATDTTKTVRLTYRVSNGLRFFDEHDELYWNVTGDEWEVPIESASAHVKLPAGVSGVRATAFRGAYGSTEQTDVSIGPDSVDVQTARGLGMREGLTIVVGWNPGVVHRPTAAEKVADTVYSNLPLAIPALVFIGMLRLWRRRGRDPELAPITTQYEPPAQMTPAELGTLIDGKPDMRDITSTVVDLAVRGYVHITETKDDHLFGLWASKDYTFTLKKARSEWTGLRPHERDLLEALFDSGLDSVTLSDLKNKFYKHLPGLREGLYGVLVSGGFYTGRPDRVRVLYMVLAVVLGFAIGGISAVVMTQLGMQPVAGIVAGVLSAIIIGGFGWFMPSRTVRGTRELEKVLGFREFLSRVEGDRLDRMVKTPEMFEKFLPYAMALGVEDNWAKAFEGIYNQPPSWYTGPAGVHTFRPSSFANSLGVMSTQAASVMASAPRSSGGSGFGGGGSSGGGFGGGGGGGF
jgi:uncharacterized membrane protein